MPTVGRYRSISGVPNGDCGMVFERTCEISYDFAFGLASSGAQRCHVAVPRLLAMPSSSPAGQRDSAAAPATSVKMIEMFGTVRSCLRARFAEPIISAGISRGNIVRVLAGG